MNNRVIIILILILGIASGIFHYWIKKRPTYEEIREVSHFIKGSTEWIGKFAPDFEIGLLSGEDFKLSEKIGKEVIILNFFATWCAPCKAELPELNRFYQNHKDEKLILIGIDEGEKEDVVKQFAIDHEVSFPVGIDKDLVIQKRYGVKNYPTTVFIGVDGKIALYEIGAISNADVTFGSLYRLNMEILSRGGGIEKEMYLKTMRLQEDKDLPKRDIRLVGRAKEFAERMYCPSCGRKLIECEDRVSKSIKERLIGMELDDKTDEEILKEIFLVERTRN